MAQIRIVDDWLRSPASPPSHYRSVMVIAEKWAEQRVLMRAYAQSRDQTMPTILLHGIELAIGPAGLDHNGPWGIHVGGDNSDGRAQAVRGALEESARRIAGSKGNPPRLVDESQTFDREPTGNWAPGTPRVLPQPAAGQLRRAGRCRARAATAGRDAGFGRAGPPGRPAPHAAAPARGAAARARRRCRSPEPRMTRDPSSPAGGPRSATRRDPERNRRSCASGWRRTSRRSSAGSSTASCRVTS